MEYGTTREITATSALCSLVVNPEGAPSTVLVDDSRIGWCVALHYIERRRMLHHSENRKIIRIQNVRRGEGSAGRDWSVSSSVAVTSSLSSSY